MPRCLRCLALGLGLLLARPLGAADTWRHFTQENGLPGNEVQMIEQDEDGILWIGTLSGLATAQDGKFTVRLPKAQIWTVLRLAPGRYWVGAAGGAVLLDGEKKENSLPGTTVAPIVRFNDTTIWAISKNLGTERNTLMEHQGQGWQAVEKFKGERVADLLRADGQVWVTVEGNGIWQVDPQKPLADARRHLDGTQVSSSFRDRKGRVWCGLWGGGVAAGENGQWARHLTKEKSAILAIREDAKGTIWVSTSANGLWRFDGQAWTNDLKDEGSINMLATTRDGRVWISTQMVGGLRYWDGAKWVVSLDTPLAIRVLCETRDGELWAGSVLEGVYVLAPKK